MKKILILVLVLSLFLGNLPVVLAQEAPSAPSAPSSPIAPHAPSAPDAPSSPSLPGSNPSPTSFPQPTPTLNENPTPTRTPRSTQISPPPSQSTDSPSPTPAPGQPTGGEIGETRILTGDATSDATVITTGNNNGSANQGSGNGSASFSTNGNGTNSTNDTSIHISNDSNTIQNNSAAVNTNLNQNANTGENSSSGNVGDTYIKTGDANVSGTIITSVNTNVDGVIVSEFTIADDHRGDIILDFGAQCISGCNGGENVKTAGNGANSTNMTTIDTSSSDATFQNNDAVIGNALTLHANSGNNTASYNTGGESIIYTGDANISANVLTFANNNIQGNVVYGVVNIYGDLVGDIIFPEEQLAMTCCGTKDVTVNTSGNGAHSTNSTNIHTASADQTFQTNDAIIQNNIVIDAQTGNNTVAGNTSGDNRVITGNSNIDTNVINVANNNIDGGNMWLVIINEAGKWIGKIFGGNGSHMAASEGTMLSTDAQGNIIATNANGAHSINTTNVNNSSNSTTNQNNAANIQNTLNLSANTGGNQASYNTGGNSSVVTGDANIIANMVNFVNNNITGNGKLFVTVVNVFGSWLGDFILPGQKKQFADTASIHATEKTTEHIGGTNVLTSHQKAQIEQSIEGSGEKTSVITVQEQSPTPGVRQTFRRILQASVVIPQEGEEVIFENNQEKAVDVPQATITPIIAGKKVVKINLAWLIFLIPGAILFLTLRLMIRKLQQRLP